MYGILYTPLSLVAFAANHLSFLHKDAGNERCGKSWHGRGVVNAKPSLPMSGSSRRSRTCPRIHVSSVEFLCSVGDALWALATFHEASSRHGHASRVRARPVRQKRHTILTISAVDWFLGPSCT